MDKCPDATLDIILNEGTSTEQRRRVRRPLAAPGLKQILAYIQFFGNNQQPKIWVPEQDPPHLAPPKPKSSAQLGHRWDSENQMSFRTAAANLALQQSRRISDRWSPEQRDCTGLIRFVYREALSLRTKEQRQRLGLPTGLPFPPVSAGGRAQFPWFPWIWTVKPGGQDWRPYADAGTLIQYNFKKKSRSLDHAQTADVLAFYNPESPNTPWHLMLYAGGRKGHEVVVYHNGDEGLNADVRVVRRQELLASPFPEWRADTSNPNFIGVFEWQVLRQAEQS